MNTGNHCKRRGERTTQNYVSSIPIEPKEGCYIIPPQTVTNAQLGCGGIRGAGAALAVAKLQGVDITSAGTPSAGDVLTATSGTAAANFLPAIVAGVERV